MIEAALVLTAVTGLAALAFLGPLVPLSVWLWTSTILTAVGLVLGVPTGIVYHVRLHACLAPRGDLPPRWWLQPVAFHDRLRDEERPQVLGWFLAGGLGFAFCALGCAAAVAGLLVEALRQTS